MSLPNNETKTSRNDFINIIREHNYAIGVEVGVREGFFSRFLLEGHPWRAFYGVDYSPNLGYIRTLQKDFPNFRLMPFRSPEVADQFANNFFDFIYIDAGHTYEDVIKDLWAWWPKLKVGGLFCGDDYKVYTHPVEGVFGVIEATIEFFSKIKRTFNILKDYNDQWWLIK